MPRTPRSPSSRTSDRSHSPRSYSSAMRGATRSAAHDATRSRTASSSGARSSSRSRRSSGFSSLPFDRARWLRRDVEDHPVDVAQLVDHARRDLLEQVVRQAGPVGGHRVVGGHRADDDDRAVGALVALDADRADVGQDAERLPELAVQAGLADLVLEHEVRVTQQVEALLRGLAPDDADREPGTRERLAPDQALGQAELCADGADLVLEERAQRLDELELQVVRQAADVVVRLDRRRAGAAARLDDVRVQRALHEVLGVAELRGLLLEDADELGADRLALG